MIEQRPDMRAAEEQLHSTSALVGVAVANMLPNFTISANGGYMNTALAEFLLPQNVFWTVAGNVTQTVFDGGTLLHDLREARRLTMRRLGAIAARLSQRCRMSLTRSAPSKTTPTRSKRHVILSAPRRIASTSCSGRSNQGLSTC